MNRTLLDPNLYTDEYPDKLIKRIHWGDVSSLKFDKSGDYLAVGLESGQTMIVDVDSWEPQAELLGHVAFVQNFNWAPDSSKLLSCARDWQVILWDTANLKKLASKNLGGSIWEVAGSPKNFHQLVAARYEAPPVFVDLQKDVQLDIPGIDKSECVTYLDDDRFLLGTKKGKALIMRHVDGQIELVQTIDVAGSTIRGLYNAPQHSMIVFTCQDRSLRVFRYLKSEENYNFESIRKLVHITSSNQWLNISLSPSGTHVLATAENSKEICMWETETGRIDHTLECPDEDLIFLESHPSRLLLVASGFDTGTTYVWAKEYSQKWDALNPDFVELVENEIYQEREDEFDILVETADQREIIPSGQEMDIWAKPVGSQQVLIPVQLETNPLDFV